MSSDGPLLDMSRAPITSWDANRRSRVTQELAVLRGISKRAANQRRRRLENLGLWERTETGRRSVPRDLDELARELGVDGISERQKRMHEGQRKRWSGEEEG